MSEHYFSQKPQSKSSPKTWKYTLRNKEFVFTSDIGVFSKNEVDFGSRLLIEAFKTPSVSGDILDVGCGYGPIGIAIASSYPERNVVMVDINERALTLAKENVIQNNLRNVEVLLSDRFVHLKERSFAAIITNPPIRAGKKTVHAILEESKTALTNDGELWVVIQKKQGAPSAIKKMEEVFGNTDVVTKSKGYFILRSVKT